MFLSFLLWHVIQVLLPEVEEVSVLPQLPQFHLDRRGGQIESQSLV